VSSCAYPGCRGHFRHTEFSPKKAHLVRKGFFYRSSDRRLVQRFQCKLCFRYFSSATRSECFMQKKRTVNSKLFELLVSGVSERRAAALLRVDRRTVVRKSLFLGRHAKRLHQAWVKNQGQFSHVQFDEMESFERSKCLPLSIPLVVDAKSRAILGLRVASMPAKGPLAAISLKKYGPRVDHRPLAARKLWSEMYQKLAKHPTVTSDMNPKYPNWIKPHFKKIKHITVKGKRGCIVGQGELKKIGFDPLFALNHTAASLRANINRLFRRTWCTTKLAERLELRLYLFAYFHNTVLINRPA